jgi:hypothetical protein
METTTVTVGLDVLQGIVAAIPGGIALWNAFIGIRTQNPNISAAEALTLAGAIATVLGTVGPNDVAQLALTPPVVGS